MSKRKQTAPIVAPDPTAAITGVSLYNMAAAVRLSIAERMGGKLIELLATHAATGAMGMPLSIDHFCLGEDPRICPEAAAQSLSSFLTTRGIASEVDVKRQQSGSGAMMTSVMLKISWKEAFKA